MALQTDELLQERYRIVRAIKSGGFGSVYEACDTKLADSRCAIKEILEKARLGNDSEYIQKSFYQEMSALSKLDHPSIPKVRDYLNTENSIYIVMDLVQGQGLEDELVDSIQMTGGPPAPERVVKDMISLLETLNYLHKQKPPIVHRDIKPGNVLRDRRTGNIKLVDFGLARRMDEKTTQTIVGTLGYCAPEQLMGKSEPRSDLFSVGMTMSHMLTGTQPEMVLFEVKKLELPGLRAGLAEIILKATQPKPDDRYASAQEMIADLQTWLDEGHNLTPAAGPLFAIPALATNLRTGVAPLPQLPAPPTDIDFHQAAAPEPLSAPAPVVVAEGSKWKAAAIAASICAALGVGVVLGHGRTQPPAVASAAQAPAVVAPSPVLAAPVPTPAPVVKAPVVPPHRHVAHAAPPHRSVHHHVAAAPPRPHFVRPVPQEKPPSVDTPSVDKPSVDSGAPHYAQYNPNSPRVREARRFDQQLQEQAAEKREKMAARWRKNHPHLARRQRRPNH